MIVLLDGLPDDSRVRSAPTAGWTQQLELMALLIEEVGLLASDRRREEPLTIVRPSRPDTAAGRSPGLPDRTQTSVVEDQTPCMTGHRQMLAAALQRGMVRG
ncbi:hypothetical protein ABTY59_31760 [Streptomyces sp. NPDC096079]|uniref:hypothetical protein n=1 Tax=Streptomyces sp. NPDC096079 TaxID=3155820 RepID=UPI00332FD6C1